MASVIALGPWGGSGGEIPWSYRASHRITEIVLRVEGNIKFISFKDASGLVSSKFGGMGNDPSDRGKEKKIEINSPSEYLKSISGSYGVYEGLTVITSLSFITNITPYGPFGTASEETFSIPIAEDVIVGFFGRYGHYLDSIGIFVTPKDNKKTISIGPWGGQGGDPWSYKANGGINKIVLNVGINIKSIAFGDTTGLDSATFGGKNPDDIGETKTILFNCSSEYLKSIKGSYGTYEGYANSVTITSLSFTTNIRTYGPFGTDSGTRFSVPINNDTIVGFHGRAGDYLDSIGIYVEPGTPIQIQSIIGEEKNNDSV